MLQFNAHLYLLHKSQSNHTLHTKIIAHILAVLITILIACFNYSLSHAQSYGITTIAGTGTLGYSGDGGQATLAKLYQPTGLTVDGSGNVYIVDRQNQVIRKLTVSTGIITTIAGNGTASYSGDGGLATSASLNGPTGVALDASGNIYIADYGNSRIRKVTVSTGIISTYAGNGTQGYSGDGAAATSANLYFPEGVAFDASYNLYIADQFNNCIRKVNASTGIITTVAGTGTQGYSGDNGQATSAKLNQPTDVKIDAAGNIYIADSFNHCIRKVTISTGVITTIAGTGTLGYSGDGSAATSAQLYNPFGIALDAAGNIYIGDLYNNRVRKVTISTGNISTIAGTGTSGYNGDGISATTAQIFYAFGVAVDASGNVYIADRSNHRIRKIVIDKNQIITFSTLASKTYGDASFSLTATASSGLPVTYSSSNTSVATISSSIVTIVGAGTTNITASQPGNSLFNAAADVIQTLTVSKANQTITFNALSSKTYGDASFSLTATASSGLPVTFSSSNTSVATISGSTVTIIGAGTTNITASQSGNALFNAANSITQSLTVNKANQTISGQFDQINTIAGTGILGYSGDGGTATSAQLYQPTGLTVDGSGNVYIVDRQNQLIRKLTISTGIITTVAGNGTQGYGGDGGLATNASLNGPTGVALDAAGNMYIADYGNSRIRKVTISTGIITTYAGTGFSGFGGDGGLATNAKLYYPEGVAFDSNYNLYIADQFNNCIRKVTASTGIITTVAGSVVQGYSGDGGPAVLAKLNQPTDVKVDASGNIYIADCFNHRIRKVNISTGVISTIAGTGTLGYSGDGAIATSAQLYNPFGIALDASGNVYIGDLYNNRVRKVSISNGYINTIAGTGIAGYNGDGILPTLAQIYYAFGVALDGSGNVYIADRSNHRIRKISISQTLSSKTYGDPSFTITGSSSSGLTVTYSSSNTSVATISGNTVTIVGAGTTNITASQPGNSNYNAATDITQTLTVNKANQTISFNTLGTKKLGDASFTLTATTNSGLPVTYSSSNSSVATISGSTVTMVGAGTTNITASQPGNTNYNEASNVVQALKVEQVITALENSNDVKSQVSIYPNPTNGLLNITLPETGFNGAKYQLIDSEGIVVQEGVTKEANFTLSLQGLSQGIYFLNLSFNNQQVVKRIIKN